MVMVKGKGNGREIMEHASTLVPKFLEWLQSSRIFCVGDANARCLWTKDLERVWILKSGTGKRHTPVRLSRFVREDPRDCFCSLETIRLKGKWLSTAREPDLESRTLTQFRSRSPI